MLVRAEDHGALVIGQLSHAWISGQLARAWGNERFSPPQPREELALGAEQHDIGWALFDLSPRLSAATGLPRSFIELSAEEHLEIWRGAPARLLAQSTYAALVVSLHGRSLSELRAKGNPDQAPVLQPHIDEEQERQDQLSAKLGLAKEDVERIRRQMWTWDGISLALCHAWRPFVARDVPARDELVDVELRDAGDGRVTLDPWPLAVDRLEVRCEARRLEGRYEDEGEMVEALEGARPLTLAFQLSRL